MDPLRLGPLETGRPLGDIPAPAAPAAAPAGAPAQVPFEALLQQAVETANTLSLRSDALNQSLVEGKAVDLHRVVLAQTEAQIAFDLVMQMRDKLVSAYQEVMRMPM
ncbi:MAG TPA: flagellar hook-basal body complex protein FliE [Candidatus Saccharimonadales bacterium]|nr:flagellar hook-basal body complex protein FliE [Candidatus Saccharimonadales bacterium]